jgi:hypothetical protein
VNTSEILDKAADLIEERGWNQGWYVNDCGGMCVRGAMFAAVGVAIPVSKTAPWPTYEPQLGRDVYAATVVMDEHVRTPVERWNDYPRRTAAEVVEALRAAARAET